MFAEREDDRPEALRRTLPRVMGAVAMLAVGSIHLEQLIAAGFWYFPVIGPLFAVNFRGSVIVGFALLAPLGLVMPRWQAIAHRLVVVLGVAVAGLGLVILLVSEYVPVVGFVESGYRPEVIVAIVADAAAIVLLSAFLFMPLAPLVGIERLAGVPTDHAAGARSG